MKRTLIIAICLMMVATVAFAEKPAEDAKYAPEKSGTTIVDRDYDEGFETSVPPAGWTTTITNPSYTWQQTTLSFYEGAAAAECVYDPALVPQDEWMFFDYTIGPGETHLNFAAMASYYWAVDPYQNYNLFVTVNGTTVWDFVTDYATETSYEWKVYDIDLSAYDGQTVTIGFGYVGSDGAQGAFDRIGINDGYTPPPPPPGDTCEDPLVLPNGEFTINTDTTIEGLNNDYDPGSGGCTGYGASGADLVYVTNLDVGQTLSVLMNADYDDSIYLITDCADPVGSCVAGSDLYPSGSNFTYTATAAGVYYLIVDGYSGAGTATITGTNEGNVTAVDDASWSTIKALYR
ncbi:MAG: hypothetical protein GF405_10315 [Candidatus Eisenbacteria bacterium]|nr:hypothetical protein [Candidatus Eisenbacteria bacterium]